MTIANPRKRALWAPLISSTLPATVLAILLWSDWLPPRIEGVQPPTNLDMVILSIATLLTLLGCGLAVVALRNVVRVLPWWVVLFTCILVATLLRVLFDTVPQWPFADIGLMMAWTVIAALVHAIVLCAAGWIAMHAHPEA